MLSTVRVCTAGSVDDGKSTFVGRLLHDTKNILADQYESLARGPKTATGAPDLSLLVDGLRAEREQGITIDVAYRYFATEKRSFILADTPGHEQYTRNTATGMSVSQVVVLLVDARHGITVQTRRHLTIASLLKLQHIILAVNKIDLVDYDADTFAAIAEEFYGLTHTLGIAHPVAVPISALGGDNIVDPSPHTPWYHGKTVLELLETITPATATATATHPAGARLQVSHVIRVAAQDYRGYAGRLRGGSLSIGDEVQVGARRSRVATLTRAGEATHTAHAGDSIAVTLEDTIDIARGDLITTGTPPQAVRTLTATLIHLHDSPLQNGQFVTLRHGPRTVRAKIAEITSVMDIDTLAPGAARPLAMNDIGVATLVLAEELSVEPFTGQDPSGAFILVDPAQGDTLTAGLVSAA